MLKDWPNKRFTGFTERIGFHKYEVWSSDPVTNNSPCFPNASAYRSWQRCRATTFVQSTKFKDFHEFGFVVLFWLSSDRRHLKCPRWLYLQFYKIEQIGKFPCCAVRTSARCVDQRLTFQIEYFFERLSALLILEFDHAAQGRKRPCFSTLELSMLGFRVLHHPTDFAAIRTKGKVPAMSLNPTTQLLVLFFLSQFPNPKRCWFGQYRTKVTRVRACASDQGGIKCRKARCSCV
jgi:hypothetical protein